MVTVTNEGDEVLACFRRDDFYMTLSREAETPMTGLLTSGLDEDQPLLWAPQNGLSGNFIALKFPMGRHSKLAGKVIGMLAVANDAPLVVDGVPRGLAFPFVAMRNRLSVNVKLMTGRSFALRTPRGLRSLNADGGALLYQTNLARPEGAALSMTTLVHPLRMELKVKQGQTMQSAIVGARYHGPEASRGVMNLNQLDEVRLIREPANPHDPSAVAVYRKNVMLGYLPRGDASVIGSVMDLRTVKVKATVSEPSSTAPKLQLEFCPL